MYLSARATKILNFKHSLSGLGFDEDAASGQFILKRRLDNIRQIDRQVDDILT